MKHNHIKVQSLIQRAINECGTDFALGKAKSVLAQALFEVSKIGDKRQKRFDYAKHFQDEAKKNHEKWWQTLVEGAKKAAELHLEDKNKDSQN